MSRISAGKQKSTKTEVISPTSTHKQNGFPDDLIRFSFRHFSTNDKFCYPTNNLDTYYPSLLDRIKNISDIKLSEFRANKHKSLRCHTHKWDTTSEPEGYSHLNAQLQDCEPWQFCLSANEHGRVHGILIDEVFYIVWIDVEHKLYPEKKKS
jgi:hypothetical protein